jgi:hypothetical protein
LRNRIWLLLVLVVPDISDLPLGRKNSVEWDKQLVFPMKEKSIKFCVHITSCIQIFKYPNWGYLQIQSFVTLKQRNDGAGRCSTLGYRHEYMVFGIYKNHLHDLF